MTPTSPDREGTRLQAVTDWVLVIAAVIVVFIVGYLAVVGVEALTR